MNGFENNFECVYHRLSEWEREWKRCSLFFESSLRVQSNGNFTKNTFIYIFKMEGVELCESFIAKCFYRMMTTMKSPSSSHWNAFFYHIVNRSSDCSHSSFCSFRCCSQKQHQPVAESSISEAKYVQRKNFIIFRWEKGNENGKRKRSRVHLGNFIIILLSSHQPDHQLSYSCCLVLFGYFYHFHTVTSGENPAVKSSETVDIFHFQHNNNNNDESSLSWKRVMRRL